MRHNLFWLSIFVAVLFQTVICDSLNAQGDSTQRSPITIVQAIYGDDEKAIDCTEEVKEFFKKKGKRTWITLKGLGIGKKFKSKGYYAKDLYVRYQLDGVEHDVKLQHRLIYTIDKNIERHAAQFRKKGTNSDSKPSEKPTTKTTFTSIKLPAKIIQVRTGGSGKFLICRLEANNSLFVVDVQQKKIVKQIPVSDGVVFAAGKDKLMIALPLINQLQKWDLATLKRDAAVPLGRGAPPTIAVMGCNSQGPLGLFCKDELKLWDIDSMSLRPLQNELIFGDRNYGMGLTVSADGQTFCQWITGISGQPFTVVRVDGNLTSIQKSEGHSRGGRWAMPNPDGSALLRYEGGAYSYDLRPLPLDSYKEQILLPSQDPRFVLALKQKGYGQPKYELTICSSVGFTPIYKYGVLNVVPDFPHREKLGFVPPVRYLPDLNLLVSFPEGLTSIDVREFNLKQTLDKQAQPYLFAASRPKSVIKKGETFEYQVESLTNAKTVSYKLDMGPEGMTISPSGKVTWTANKMPADGVASAVVSLEGDNGTLNVQGFEIHFPAAPTVRVADADTKRRSDPRRSDPRRPDPRKPDPRRTDPNKFAITSSPAIQIAVGETFSYQVRLSNQEKAKYLIDSGPDGMIIKVDGRVTWKVKSRPIGGVVSVTIKAKNAADEEAIQTFELAVDREISPDIPARKKIRDFASAGFVALDKTRLELPAEISSSTKGIGGRQLVLCKDKLAIMGDDGWKIEELYGLDKAYQKLYEREDYYVAVADSPQGIFIIDKKSLEVKKSFSLPGDKLSDLVLHPQLPVSYVSVETKGSGKTRFVMFDEQTGRIKEGADWVGSFLVPHPSGKHLMAGFTGYYRKGSELVINAGRLDIAPRFGAINWLLRYKIDRNGEPELSDIQDNVGNNCTGVRLSSDGEQVIYLSKGGYPRNSKDLGGWNPLDLTELPVPYSTKNTGSCQAFAFHQALPLGASPGTNSVEIYDQKTGQRLEGRFENIPPDLSTSETSNLYFSENGKHLIVEDQIDRAHYLQKLNLKLDAQELAKADAPIVDTQPWTDKFKTEKIPLAKIDALGGGTNTKLTPAEVAKNFKRAVVLIESGDGTGTGFVVGKSGYVMTCAHCISDADDINVSLLRENQKPKAYKAKLLLEDAHQDIALLKINSPHMFQTVKLGVGDSVEMGMQVTVIGNPGLGNMVLEHTMTSGIISSTRRDIDGVDHIQISAAVNPGNSGGPMFDQYGNVAGMIALKGRIEGAGFAVPANTLAEFVIKHHTKKKSDNQILRSWRQAEGTRSFVGTLLDYQNGKVRIRGKEDGKEYELGLKKLSEADRTFLSIFNKHQ